MKKTIPVLIAVLLVFSGLLTACNGKDEGAMLATSAAQTVMVVNAQQTAMAGAALQMTAAAAQTQLAAPVATLPAPNTPTLAGAGTTPITSAPAATLPPPSAAASGDQGQYVSDTVPDGTTYNPGSEFTQTWKLQNTGTSTWTSDYAIVFVSGAQMNAPAKVNLPYSVSPGMVIELPVKFKAPGELGTYKSVWMLQNASGQQFGLGANNGSFWVQITVSNLPTATNTPQASTTPDSHAVESAGVTDISRDESQKTCGHFNVNISGFINTKDAVYVEYYWDLTYDGKGSGFEDSATQSDNTDGADFGVGPWGTSGYSVKDNETVVACLKVTSPQSFTGGCKTLTIDCD